MPAIKNIIFDLGGVLMNIDYSKTTNAFKALGYSDFDNMYTMVKANKVFDNLETGHLSEAEFYRYMLEVAPKTVTREMISCAWNAMLLDFRLDSFLFLNRLGARYSLYLLSNTNTIHKKAFDELFTAQTGQASLDVFFKKAYYSQQVGMRKPNQDIFEFVLKDAGITAETSFYIDDLQPNIETANRLGFKTHLLLPGEKIENLDF